jgi:hypothetical protein
VGSLIEAQRRLRQVGHAIRVGNVQIVNVLWRIHHLGNRGGFAERPDHLVVIVVPDQDQRIAFPSEFHRLYVYLCDQRAGRIDHPQFAQLAGFADLWSDAVRAVNHALPGWYFFHAVDKNRAL